MKKFVLLIAMGLFLLVDADAFDVRLLANNKELISRELTSKDEKEVENWASHHKLGGFLKSKALNALSDSFNEIERNDTNCEVGLARQVTKDALSHEVLASKDETLFLIMYLRQKNLIDDIFYKILRDSMALEQALESDLNLPLPPKPWNLNTRQNSGMDLKKYFAQIQRWPDDIKRCSLDAFYYMATSLSWKNDKDRDTQLLKLHYLGYADGHIDLETFNRLETFRKHSVLNWPVYLNRYRDIVTNAKDKLAKVREAQATNDFSTEYVSRKMRITKRTALYRNYNSTQIMLLAQIMEKAAKRMDAQEAYLRWQFSDNPEDHEIYVLSPMEQYRASIKMLRKDMAEIMRSEAFRNKGVDFEDLIAAGYETGFIKSDELDPVLKFEELWNPKTPRWKKYATFASSIAGRAAFYLPPPLNIIGAIGLVLVESKVIYGDRQPDADDNWNVIL